MYRFSKITITQSRFLGSQWSLCEVCMFNIYIYIYIYIYVCVCVCVSVCVYIKKSWFWNEIWYLTMSSTAWPICFDRKVASAKYLPYWLHIYGFSPVCVLICYFNLLDQVNLLSHWIHIYGFSPECVVTCFDI